jgi:hypothetical protein
VLTLVLLGGLAAETQFRPRPADAEPFHKRVSSALRQMPTMIGEWDSREVPIPPAAVALLKPNAYFSRRYTNRNTGRTVDFLLVQCRDARDMGGHYPPVCYPAHGWSPISAKPVEWQVGGKPLPGMEYEFSRIDEAQTFSTVVSNLMILPTGRYVREMSEIRKAAADYLRQFYGAAQIQVVMPAAVPEEERRELVQMLLEANLPMLQTLGSGGTQ